MKLIFAVLDVSSTVGLTRCYKTEGFYAFIKYSNYLTLNLFSFVYKDNNNNNRQRLQLHVWWWLATRDQRTTSAQRQRWDNTVSTRTRYSTASIKAQYCRSVGLSGWTARVAFCPCTFSVLKQYYAGILILISEENPPRSLIVHKFVAAPWTHESLKRYQAPTLWSYMLPTIPSTRYLQVITVNEDWNTWINMRVIGLTCNMFRFVYEHEHNNNNNIADNNYNCNQLYDVDDDLQLFNANRSVARQRPQLWWRLAGYTHNKHTTVGRQQWCDDNAVSRWTRYLITGAVIQ